MAPCTPSRGSGSYHQHVYMLAPSMLMGQNLPHFIPERLIKCTMGCLMRIPREQLPTIIVLHSAPFGMAEALPARSVPCWQGLVVPLS